MAVDGYGERIAIGSHDNGSSYVDLAALSRGAATIATEHGATHVATVAVMGPLLPIVLFGSSYAGVPAVPLNYRLSTPALDELLATLEQPLVIADADFAEALRRPGRSLLTTEEFLAKALAAEPADPADTTDDDPAVLLFTSGTTSRPKCVVLTHSNLVSYVLGTVEFAGAGIDESQLVTVPPYHIAGVASALTSTYSGRRVVHLPQFSPAGWLTTVRRESVTSAMVVPTMLARIVDHLDGKRADAPSLRALAYGGARMPAPVLERALHAFPEVDFTNAYGLTETSSTIAVLGPEDHRRAIVSSEPRIRARLGSAGRAVAGVEIGIRDADGSLLAAGAVGEIVVRGPQVSGAYVGLGSVLDADGWFATRDRGWLDEDGYLYVDGRSDDVIIRGGENIAPAEVEDALVRMAGVQDCAVFGLPDDEWGERLAAAVVAEPGQEPTTDEVRSYMRSRLRGSRTPDDVFIVDALPYSATGKLLRRRLVATFARAE
ncbi:class I adenylate-forming enzyme family protein [Streptomyces sp. NPDC001276]|uniref:class I adenylate-forming enzyme family protein n=1 Tax=Streptomyces sp. NPDC001276 TaxID=3364555 RepID=UPI0036778B02